MAAFNIDFWIGGEDANGEARDGGHCGYATDDPAEVPGLVRELWDVASAANWPAGLVAVTDASGNLLNGRRARA